MTITVFGIRNCDTVRKARRHLDEAGVEYRFHDFRKDGLSEDDFSRWLGDLPVESLINKRGTSWRALPVDQREPLTNERALALALANPSLIKRPVVEWGNVVTVGFDPTSWAQHTAALTE